MFGHYNPNLPIIPQQKTPGDRGLMIIDKL